MRVRNGVFGLTMLFPLAALAGLESGGCSGGSDSTAGGTAASGGNGQTGPGAFSGGGGIGGFVENAGGGLDQDAACVATSAEATLERKPVDIVFLIDNSGSMGDHIESVQKNINDNFAAIIGASAVDYRVIMLTEHGPLVDESVCIAAPLSATDCNPAPEQPGQNPPTFHHYSIPLSSHNSWCLAIKSYDGGLPDQFGLAPRGWSEWLRKDAFKVFVEITDDNVDCTFGGVTYNDNETLEGGQIAGASFDRELLRLDPEQFGTAAKRNYIWHSIVGLAESEPKTAAYGPGDPLVKDVCGSAVAAGTGYQALSKLTGGLRFPICQFVSYDLVFKEIAKGVIEGARVACNFPVPPAPVGESIDLETVVLNYLAGGVGNPQKMKQVANEAACKPSSFYIADGIRIELCPETCALVQADDNAKIDILFGCTEDIH